MTIILVVGLTIATVLTFLPLVSKKEVTRADRFGVVKNAIILVLAVIAVFMLQMNPFVILFIALLAAVLLDKKTYTIKRFLIYTGIVTVIAVFVTLFFRPNPAYVSDHVLDHPEDTSLYIAIDGEPVIAYEDDVERPLASVVKMAVALEYAHQVAEGTIDAEAAVPLTEVDVYYLAGTDGDAHLSWKQERVPNQSTVTLQELAVGMMTYSSNATTDYLIELLGAEQIDERMQKYGFTPHDPIIPLAGSLLVSIDAKQSGNDWEDAVTQMDDARYAEKAFSLHDQLRDGTYDTADLGELSLDEQRIWSDRLPASTARVYGELLRSITQGEFDADVNAIMNELLQWPMELVPENKDHYNALGAKGGSTAFILNQAMFITTKDGTEYDIVVFTDDLTFFQGTMLNHNLNPFFLEFVNDEEFQAETIEQFKE